MQMNGVCIHVYGKWLYCLCREKKRRRRRRRRMLWAPFPFVCRKDMHGKTVTKQFTNWCWANGGATGMSVVFQKLISWKDRFSLRFFFFVVGFLLLLFGQGGRWKKKVLIVHTAYYKSIHTFCVYGSRSHILFSLSRWLNISDPCMRTHNSLRIRRMCPTEYITKITFAYLTHTRAYRAREREREINSRPKCMESE